MKKLKLLILIVSSTDYPSPRNKKVQKKTWVDTQSRDVEVIYYKAGNNTKIANDELEVKVGASTIDMALKNILAFEYVLENFQFDYLFRTTTTSYVNVENLIEFLQSNKFQNDFLYSGVIIDTNDLQGKKINFVNGAGILFNHKVVDTIVKNKNQIDYELWDDVGIGKLMMELGIDPVSGKRFDIKGNIFREEIELDHYHYRCRIDNHYGYPRFLEAYVIKILDKYVNEGSVNKFIEIVGSKIFEIFKLFYIQYPILKFTLLLKKLIKKITPGFIFNFLKEKFGEKYNNFLLKYFKY